MLNPQEFCETLSVNGIHYYTGVPDSLLKEMCACIEQTVPSDRHVIAANEGGAVGLAVGHHLASGGLPLVYLQNSGLGNVVNPLLSLADPAVYGIPMLLLIGWRGEPGVKDEPQHLVQGRVNLPLLKAMEIPFEILPEESASAAECIQKLVGIATTESRPVACMVKKGTFSAFKTDVEKSPSSYAVNREGAVATLLETLRPDDVLVSTTGKASREVYECRKTMGHDHSKDFLTVGGMGHASQIALGIALELKNRRVICFDGDGAALMHLGSMPIIGASKPPNFIHLLLNNGAHDSVGGQPTVGFQIDFCQIADACGYGYSASVSDVQSFHTEFNSLNAKSGPIFIEFKACKGARSNLGRPASTPVENKSLFMKFLEQGPV